MPLFPPGCSCPITTQIMLDPVMVADDHTYEREAIEQWFISNNTSPITREALSNKTLRPNQAIKGIIAFVLENNPELWVEVYSSETLMAGMLKAIRNKNRAEVDFIISKDPRFLDRVLVDRGTGQERTLLAWACNCGTSEILQFIINRLGGKFPTVKEIQEGHGAALMHAAAINLGVEGTRILGQRLNWQEANYREELNRLITSDIADSVKIATVYLSVQPTLVGVAIDTDGNNALHIAARHEKRDMAMVLLELGLNSKTENARHMKAADVAREAGHAQLAIDIDTKRRELKALPFLRPLQEKLRQDEERMEQDRKRIEQLEQTLRLVQQEQQPVLTKFRGDQARELQERQDRELRERQERELKLRQELTAFLRLVAEGQQDQAEAMLRTNPNLALIPGDVADLSNRRFQGITALQYAAWALDWHMWKMLLKYLPPDAARSQAQGFTTGSWVSLYGVHVNWQNLIDALKTYIDNHGKWTTSAQYANHWIHQVGGAQLLLPAHVIHEYCRPDRSFEPCPTFMEDTLPRTTKLDGGKELDRSNLGTSYGLLRVGSAARLERGLD